MCPTVSVPNRPNLWFRTGSRVGSAATTPSLRVARRRGRRLLHLAIPYLTYRPSPSAVESSPAAAARATTGRSSSAGDEGGGGFFFSRLDGSSTGACPRRGEGRAGAGSTGARLELVQWLGTCGWPRI